MPVKDQRRFRASIFKKIALLFAVSLAVLSAAIVIMDAQLTRQLARDSLIELAEFSTTDLATGVARGIRFKDQDDVAAQGNAYMMANEGRVSAVMVLGPDGDVRFSMGVPDSLVAEYSALALGVSADHVEPLDASRFAKIVPVRLGEANNRIGTVFAIWSTDGVMASVNGQKLVTAGIAIAIFLGRLVTASMLVTRMISRPLGEIGSVLRDIVDGRYDTKCTLGARSDELGAFMRDIEQLQERLLSSQTAQDAREREQTEQLRVVAALREGLNALSHRDLTRTLDEQFGDEYEPLREDFNNSLNGLKDILSSVVENASSVKGGAEEISAASDNLARRTERQAATLEETSATLNQITASVADSAENATQAEKIVLEAQEQASRNDVVVQNAVDAMSEIEKSSSQIASIISVIDDIAFQTNLLALNAGVEAARAGEAGRGFAVVATEVRSLAQRSADAAKEIKNLISGSAAQVDQGVKLVRKAGDALTEISSQVAHVSSLVSGIATSSNEQAKAVAEINSGVTQLEHVTQENAAMVEESNAAGHLLRQQANDLATSVSQFRLHPNHATAAARSDGGHLKSA